MNFQILRIAAPHLNTVESIDILENLKNATAVNEVKRCNEITLLTEISAMLREIVYALFLTTKTQRVALYGMFVNEKLNRKVVKVHLKLGMIDLSGRILVYQNNNSQSKLHLMIYLKSSRTPNSTF